MAGNKRIRKKPQSAESGILNGRFGVHDMRKSKAPIIKNVQIKAVWGGDADFVLWVV